MAVSGKEQNIEREAGFSCLDRISPFLRQQKGEA